MDGHYSSGEELILKARKPYTITKQRERWTEEEHNRFLEALKLYGRAWQRIEEHIGTKTAVQIRSHAQKFFTKLEKEAHVKGTAVGQALDIEIPPPRPKRKPSIPYPRKLVNGHPMPQVGSGNVISGTSVHSVPLTEDGLDLEREPPPEIPSDEKFEGETENQEDNATGRCCVLRGHPGMLSSSVNENCFPESGARKSLAFKRFVPNLEEEVNSDEVHESYVTIEPKDKQDLHKVDMEMAFHENICTEKSGILGEGDGCNVKVNMQATPSHSVHLPVHVVDASMDIDTPHVTPHMEYHDSIMHPSDKAHPKPSMDHSSFVNLHMAYHDSIMHAPDGANPKPFIDNSSSATCEHRTSTSNVTFNGPFPGLHPTFTPIQNHDAYQSFMQASHTFSNLVVSNLLQNPAAHAAASFAARFWPSCASACNTGGFPVGANNAPPSMEAIAAATVASATAWWAANGLLPLYPPFQMGLGYGPSVASAVPMARVTDDERRVEGNDPSSEPLQMKPKFSEAGQHLTLRSPTLSLSNTEQSNVLKNSGGLTLIETEQGGADTKHVDTDKPQGTKQVDRSSCGSNATSSSEVDTDGKVKQTEELGGNTLLHHPAGDANGRRARNSGYSSDSWKEVSEEGRLAFRALFSRVTLPQTFSPTNGGKSIIDVNQQNCNAIDDGKAWLNRCSNQEAEENAYRRDESSRKEDGMLISGKLKGRRTGFKPYKRCSVEAKEGRGLCVNNNSSQDQEKSAKRIRLEGQALS